MSDPDCDSMDSESDALGPGGWGRKTRAARAERRGAPCLFTEWVGEQSMRWRLGVAPATRRRPATAKGPA
eukprot:601030-Alexandrium_andersonii.AAC.1